MSIYISKNNQQSGPFKESQILEWLGNGQLSLNDMAIRQGDAQWQPLCLLFPNAARKPQSSQMINSQSPYSSQTASAGAVNQQNLPKKSGAGKIFLVLIGLFALGIIGTGLAGMIFMSKPKPASNNLTSAANSANTNITSENTDTSAPVKNYAEIEGKLKEFAALKPPVKLEKNPTLVGKVAIVEQRDRDNEYTLQLTPVSELSKYGLSADRLADSLAELDTLVQISCGKGKEIGRYGPRMAYVPAYSNICNVAVIDYRASKTIAQKTLVNGKKPAKIYVNESENEYVLDPPTEDVEKYLSGLVRE